jgi:hypothetical protein
MSGVYALRVRARGETMHGAHFERERTLTATATPGGDRWDPVGPKGNELCELLRCLREAGVINRELTAKLRELGIDLSALRKCLGDCCNSPADRIESRLPQQHSTSVSTSAIADLREQLLRLVDERLGLSGPGISGQRDSGKDDV